ncbi:hypothetical protein ACOI1C_18480 [Bacillus sp. DJP31]|uniref:hypothetical protein n=1 Tax=Bacillus sp. DJP31 TaxID=3409789 RepID=UPI003BB6C0F0
MKRDSQNKKKVLTPKEKALDSLFFAGFFQAITTNKANFNKRVLLSTLIILISTFALLVTIWVYSNF